ncbi:hypothetical protein SLS58_000187 [Diplodia intermedia]|uniref:chitin synthase n=1 Tax=Diplodia intermedia TaxID=856260 RepID=A0ABR3U4X9_9PEZI
MHISRFLLSGEYFDARLQIPERPDRVKIGRSPSSTENSYETGSSTLPTSTATSFVTCTQHSQEGYFTGPEDAVTETEEEPPKAVRFEDTVAGCGYPEIEDPVDPARVLGPKDLRNQRIFFFTVVVSLNLGCAAIALFAHEGMFVFVFILFIKSKDFLSVIVSALGLLFRKIYRYFKPLAPVPQQWILTLIPAYSESEEQIVKTIYSLRDNDIEPHRQVMVVLLDGRHRDVKSHMTRVIREFERPYISLKHKRGVLQIKAGFMEDVPVIVIEKVKNSGKKDSLVLCHDLFNHPRHNLPLYTRLLREELWRDVLPILTEGADFQNFDMVFCTDADSTIYKGAVASLANALARDKDAIAACGLVLVELEPGFEWSFWNLYQQFQGTDRRLTYSMLSQSKKLHTLFVPEAVSETVAPQSLQHYLSQRRRWGSNAYFNNYFYWMGEEMIVITRIAASVEVIRLSFVYYRILNTILFVKGLTQGFSFIKIMPLLIVSQLPTMWFMFCVFCLEDELKKRAHKLLIGYCINKCISPLISLTVFTKVARNLGSQVWGMSGVTASSAPAATSEAEQAADLAAAEKGEAGILTPGERAQIMEDELDDPHDAIL